MEVSQVSKNTEECVCQQRTNKWDGKTEGGVGSQLNWVNGIENCLGDLAQINFYPDIPLYEM